MTAIGMGSTVIIMTHVDAPERRALQAAASAAVRARVKWYNSDKGFGFVAPLNGAPDAFLHASTLSRAGLGAVEDGSEVLCEVVEGAKGPQVVRVMEVTLPADEPAAELSGAVKWYSAEKGFGFVVADDGGRDVFVHKSVMRRAGFDLLQAGCRLRVRAVETPKGREAVEILA